ncbi:MAG TPA: L-histidine N(alpha)-methyltransferase [Rhizomicrobium sp.]|jgi:dimethylhistidine N-methyltransferase
MFDEAEVRSRDHEAFRADVLQSLSGIQKTLPCRWLYDSRGSELFEAITRLPEYYPTRAETAILRQHAADIAGFVGRNATLLEYGAGSAIKTELVLDALDEPRAYVPIDIAGEFLALTAARLGKRFPSLRIWPIVADFMGDLALPAALRRGRRVGFFPGSTIGNLGAEEATQFLARMRRHVGAHGAAIVGVDLKKDQRTLLAAYDDQQGVTAAFNSNLLVRINRELGGDFDLKSFAHAARWNESESAVEMHLVSLAPQTVTVAKRRFAFFARETIHTESSRKYDRPMFEALASDGGWLVRKCWTDEGERFAVFGLEPA